MNSNFKPLIFRFLYMRFKGDISGLDELRNGLTMRTSLFFQKLAGMRHGTQRIKRHFKTGQGTLPMQTVGALSAMVRLWICGWKRTAPIPMQ